MDKNIKYYIVYCKRRRCYDLFEYPKHKYAEPGRIKIFSEQEVSDLISLLMGDND